MTQISPKLYPLSESQNLSWFQSKYNRNALVMQIPLVLTVSEPLDFTLLQRAIEVEHVRNDSLRMRFVQEGETLRQYFARKVTPQIAAPVDFTGKSQKAQDRYFARQAAQALDYLNGDIARFVPFTPVSGGTGLFLLVSHLCMDASAILLMVRDLFSVYDALKTGSSLPEPLAAFQECLVRDLSYLENERAQKRDSEFFARSYGEFGEPIYAGMSGSWALKLQRFYTRRKNQRAILATYALTKRVRSETFLYPKEKFERAMQVCANERLDFNALLQLALRSHASKINGGQTDVSYNIVSSRRATKADMRSGGCRMQAAQINTRILPEMTAREAAASLTQSNLALLRHINYSSMRAIYTIYQLYHTPKLGVYSSFVYTFLPASIDLPDGWRASCKWINTTTANPLYIFILPDLNGEGLRFGYDYRPSHISKRQIRHLHENTARALDAIIENPDIAIGTLLNEKLK